MMAIHTQQEKLSCVSFKQKAGSTVKTYQVILKTFTFSETLLQYIFTIVLLLVIIVNLLQCLNKLKVIIGVYIHKNFCVYIGFGTTCDPRQPMRYIKIYPL